MWDRKTGAATFALIFMVFAGHPAQAAEPPPVEAVDDATALVIFNKLGRDEPLFTDAHLAERLGERRDWTRVEVWRAPHLTDAALASLADMPDLRVLKLSTSAITDAGLEIIARMPALTTLEIMPAGKGLAATNAGVAALGTSPTLEAIALRIKHLDDTGLAGLAEAPRLRRLTLLNPNDALHISYTDPNRPHDWFIQDGVSRIKRPGLEALTRSGTLTHLHLEGAHITDEDAAVVARIPHLESLDWVFEKGHPADDGRFGDDFLRALALAPKLKELRLSAFMLQAGLEGIEALAERGQLTRLSLDILRLPPAQHDTLLAVIGRFPRLESLEIHQYSPKFTDDGFRRLAPLTAMKTFVCYAPEITDDALSTMDDWNDLATLRLEASKLTDALLRWAAKRPALRELTNTYSSRFTDAGLDAIGADSGLRFLKISGRFSRGKVDALKARLPQADIPLRGH